MRSDERLDGWKAIGAHFGRDRTTVIRWARDRGLPVRAVPGGRTRTVYALRSELDVWAAKGAAPVDPDPAPEPVIEAVAAPVVAPATPQFPVRRATAVVAAACGLAGLGGLLALRPSSPRAPALPADPRVAAVYVQARDDWGQRTAAGLARAIDGFTRVTRGAPGFAPAWASLADAWLLAREDGAAPDAPAFAAARSSADRAAALDPGLAAAQRARGFVAYWWDRDRARARDAFRAALRRDPADAQTHLWWATILTDNGDWRAAMREYDAARLLDPGSTPIRTERAWALWTQGREAEGAADLAAIVAQAPANEEAHDMLSVIALSRGDFGGYVREMRVRARLRAEPAFGAWVDALERAQAASGPRAVLAAALHHALAYRSPLPFHTDAWSAWIASLSGDRAALLAVLRTAEAGHETWGMAGYQRRLAQRWGRDPEIAPLLARRRPPTLED